MSHNKSFLPRSHRDKLDDDVWLAGEITYNFI